MPLLLHDVGEILHGDIKDDGTRPNDVELEEAEFIQNEILAKVPDIRLRGYINLYLYLMRNHAKGDGELLYMIDKHVLPLAHLVYESFGRGGSLDFKSEPTAEDLASKEYTGSTKPADILLCNTLRADKNQELFKHPAFPILIEIIQSAAKAVRGEEMEWLHRLIQDHH